MPLEWYAEPHGWPERMRLFEDNAIALLAEAAGHCLAVADVPAKDIAATVTVSSTSVVTPSLDSLLQEPLGLSPNVQRLPVFGLGCAGGYRLVPGSRFGDGATMEVGPFSLR